MQVGLEPTVYNMDFAGPRIRRSATAPLFGADRGNRTPLSTAWKADDITRMLTRVVWYSVCESNTSQKLCKSHLLTQSPERCLVLTDGIEPSPQTYQVRVLSINTMRAKLVVRRGLEPRNICL